MRKMDVLMTRYILEIMQDSHLIKLYEKGNWYPNFDNYRLFLHKQEKNNQNLAKLIQRYRLVKSKDHLIETVFSHDINSVSFYLDTKDTTLIKTSYGTIQCSCDFLDSLVCPTCYISNGFFRDTETIALKLVGHGSFVVGVCDHPDSIFYKENEKRMNDFEKILRKRHIPYKQFQHKNHRDKASILYYRSDSL